MSESISAVANYVVKWISKNWVIILPGVAFLIFWIVVCPSIRDGFNLIFKYFGWGFEWYGFLEGFSQLQFVRYIFSLHVS